MLSYMVGREFKHYVVKYILEMDIALLRRLFEQRRGLASVQLQNHIYGCYLIMEDIATKALTLDNGILTGSYFTIDLTREFQNIGLRYGFVMDTKLALSSDLPAEYQAGWMAFFTHLSKHSDALSEVDIMEDQINTVIKESIRSDDAFFIKAVEHGVLPQDWLGKLIHWLQHGDQPVETAIVEEPTTKLSQANTEKIMEKPRRRILSSTIRHRPNHMTRTTRRAHKQ
jgi:hypothetical protein